MNGSDPLVDTSSDWARSPSSSGIRTRSRHRKRRRSRRASDVRARIRVRMWIACTGALLVMAAVLYLALGRDRGGESGQYLGGSARTVAASTGAVPSGA
jgi:hypothetical protein